MVLFKVKIAASVFLALGITALSVGGLLPSTRATEPVEQGQAKPDNLPERVAELKQQLQQMQKEIAKLERETQARDGGRGTPNALTDLFKYRVAFETGETEFNEGGRIEIREVWGTRPKIEVGGQYLVRGKYTMPAGQRGKLYFYETADGDWNTAATLDLQTMTVEKREGEFTLVHGMAGPGYFHVYLSAEDRYSRAFANVYFGTGDNVWRKKP